MVNNLVFRWPKPLFFMVLGAHGTQYQDLFQGKICASGRSRCIIPTIPERGKHRRRLPGDESFMNVGERGKTQISHRIIWINYSSKVLRYRLNSGERNLGEVTTKLR